MSELSAPMPVPSLAGAVARQSDYWRTVYRRTWRGSVISSFLQPFLYVGAMGLLLGDYINASTSGAELGAPSYLAFIAPGLLAAQGMQVAVAEVMWPVLGAIKWNKTYVGMIATPLSVADIVAAHFTFVLFRVSTSCLVFTLALAPFEVYESAAGALVAFVVSVLVGMAFATTLYAFSAGVDSEQWFGVIMRIVVMPLFLFSGAFFPITNLAPALEAFARITPLWHGVDLARMATLDDWDVGVALVHVTYLGVMLALGWWWAIRRLTRRLVF